MTEPLPKESPQRAADDLIAMFERQIFDGELREGDPLPPEREIVQAFGVSRTVVREAVLALANKGLVEARPRFRPVVRKPDFDAAFEAMGAVANRLLAVPGSVKSLFDLRIMMEASLVREAAMNADKSHIAALREALDANERAINDSAIFYQTDIAFHRVFFDVPDNPLLPSINRAYTDWLSRQWTKMPRLPDRNRINYNSHKAIFDAILLRDPDAAEAALRMHLDDAWGQVRQTFGDI